MELEKRMLDVRPKRAFVLAIDFYRCETQDITSFYSEAANRTLASKTFEGKT